MATASSTVAVTDEESECETGTSELAVVVEIVERENRRIGESLDRGGSWLCVVVTVRICVVEGGFVRRFDRVAGLLQLL